MNWERAQEGCAYVHVDRLHERLWAAQEANSYSCREDLGQAVESQHSADVGLFQLK